MPLEETDWDDDWRETCLEVLRIRRQELAVENPADGLSWQAVRNEIMRPYDTYDREGAKPKYEDNRLRRQNLIHWDNGKKLRADKFMFIDRYVRELDVLGLSDNIRNVLRRRTCHKHLKLLSSIYRDASLGSEVVSILQGIPRLTYVNQLSGSHYSGLFLVVDYVSEYGVGAILGYCPKAICDMTESDAQSVIFYNAYLIPMSFDTSLDDLLQIAEDASGLKFREIYCLVKAFRPEYRGLPEKGYADGEMSIRNFQDRLHGIQDDQDINYSIMKLDYPNPVADPYQSDHHRPARYVAARVSQQNKAPWPSDDDAEGMSTSNPTDFYDTETWRLEFKAEPNVDNIIENIINITYKGYLV